MIIRDIYNRFRTLQSRIGIRYNSTGKVALNCIGKCENNYIREWVEYHKSLGFDKIFIYDNNDIDGEHFEDVIGDYVEQGFCEIIDFRGRKCCQEQAYHDCYVKNNKEYDWIAVFDIDEFLTLKQHSDVHEFLDDSRYSNYQVLHLNWMCYGDNEMLDSDGRLCQERFSQPLPFDVRKFSEFPENNHIKSIVRGGLKHINWRYIAHTPWCFYRCCNADGEECDVRSPFTPYTFEVAFFRHYQTKTIGEWIKVKQARGYADTKDEIAKECLVLDVFYMLNKRTPEKDAYVEALLKK